MRSPPALGPCPPPGDGLRTWRLIVDAPEMLGVEALHPGAAVLAEQWRGDLLATARVLVDTGGDVAAAAEEVHVHRTTLHYRLDRIKELTGVDLHDGRSRAHIQLALWLAAYRACD